MDDTTTITPEERARLRELADKSYLLPLDEGEVPSVGFDGLTDDRIAYIAAACNSVPLLLDALEQAEARAEKAEAEVARLKAERRYLANALSSYGDEDEEMSAEDWEQSARRAVAAGEEICPKQP